MYIMLNNRPLNTADIISISEVRNVRDAENEAHKVLCEEDDCEYDEPDTKDAEHYVFSIRVRDSRQFFVNHHFSHESPSSRFIFSKRYEERAQAQTALEHLLSEINDLWGSLKRINI